MDAPESFITAEQAIEIIEVEGLLDAFRDHQADPNATMDDVRGYLNDYSYIPDIGDRLIGDLRS